ncbi:MAG: ABC-2 family transporter protein [Verrucomicrobia bacterium]|nr:ABC-2 family transporter protein [Verrucomicrobiota bacterium]
MSLFFQLLLVSIRSDMQYRASFFMLAIAHFFSTFVSILGIWVLFDRFQVIEGWSFAEVAVLYGMMHISFAIAECFARGFDTFDEFVKYGDFDRVLLRPVSPLLLIATHKVQLMRVGRFLQGCTVLTWGLCELNSTLPASTYFVLALSILGTSSLFYGLLIIQATVCFWTTESLELMNITTYGGLETAQYPMSIYPVGFRLIFTLVIPLACVGYYPLALLLKQETFATPLAPLLPFIFPLVGVLFLLLACRFWHTGVRHYLSTGN